MQTEIETVMVDIEILIPDPNNERKHDEKNLKAIRGSLKQFGQVEPLVVRRSNNILIGGHGRLEAMKSLGMEKVSVHYVDFDELKSAALRVALNRTAELATWNDLILGSTLQSLREDGFDLGEIGFDLSALDIIGTKNENGTDPEKEWEDMPEFANEDISGVRQLIVTFANNDDVRAFAELVQQNITDKTKSIWYPKAEIVSTTGVDVVSES